MKHRFTIERLYHFNCGLCGKWWSISDWEVKPVMYCPHCGSAAEVENTSDRDD